MLNQKRILGFPPLLILILFFMPWVTLSCSGETDSASGYQLAVEGSLGEGSDVRIPILVIGIAAAGALAIVVFMKPINIKYYTGAGFAAAISYSYLLLRVGSLSQEAREQGARLTLELPVWGIGLAIMGIIGLGIFHRIDESDTVSTESDDAIKEYHRAQQVQQDKMMRSIGFGVLVLLGGVIVLSLLQPMLTELSRRIPIGGQVSGHIKSQYVSDQYTFSATAGELLLVKVTSDDFNPEISVNLGGRDSRESSIFSRGRFGSSLLVLFPTQSDIYTISIFDSNIIDSFPDEGLHHTLELLPATALGEITLPYLGHVRSQIGEINLAYWTVEISEPVWLDVLMQDSLCCIEIETYGPASDPEPFGYISNEYIGNDWNDSIFFPNPGIYTLAVVYTGDHTVTIRTRE